MTDDRQQPIKFRSPGSGGKGSKHQRADNSPEAALQISDLLGDMTRSQDMLIEALHLIQDRYRCQVRIIWWRWPRNFSWP